MKMIKSAIIPVAGMGTRMLPATKSIAKEMLPVFDRPVIQHVVEEVLDAGFEELIFIENPEKQPIAQHFRPASELINELCRKGKFDLADALQSTVVPDFMIKTAMQAKPLGLGHAVLQALPMLEEGPFAVVLPDEVYLGKSLPMQELVAFHAKHGGNVIGTMQVPDEQIERYGIAEIGTDETNGGFALTGMVEKPKLDVAPSNHAVVGRYILDKAVFQHLMLNEVGVGGEIQLTDAIAATLGKVTSHALPVSAQRYDCGDRMGWVSAQAAFADAYLLNENYEKEILAQQSQAASCQVYVAA